MRQLSINVIDHDILISGLHYNVMVYKEFKGLHA